MPSLQEPNTVVVLGAGATKAFMPTAPLAVDDYNIKQIKTRFSHFQHASALLDAAMAPYGDGRVDIEQLITRLYGRMPYDSPRDASERANLAMVLTQEFLDRIKTPKTGIPHKDALDRFASICIAKGITCITFNYDDTLDQSLWGVKREHRGSKSDLSNYAYWHPDGGYGFFLRSSDNVVQAGSDFMDKTPTLLLKLHGSINWFPKLGEVQPYRLDSLYHHQSWYPPENHPPMDRELVARHLEQMPFFVPPALDKKALANEPILQLIWSLAKDCLLKARSVYFVGYSMPITDLAASFLFKETLGTRPEIIQVVNYASQDSEKAAIRSTYEKIFGKLQDAQFVFDGALKWASELPMIK